MADGKVSFRSRLIRLTRQFGAFVTGASKKSKYSSLEMDLRKREISRPELQFDEKHVVFGEDIVDPYVPTSLKPYSHRSVGVSSIINLEFSDSTPSNSFQTSIFSSASSFTSNSSLSSKNISRNSLSDGNDALAVAGSNFSFQENAGLPSSALPPADPSPKVGPQVIARVRERRAREAQDASEIRAFQKSLGSGVSGAGEPTGKLSRENEAEQRRSRSNSAEKVAVAPHQSPVEHRPPLELLRPVAYNPGQLGGLAPERPRRAPDRFMASATKGSDSAQKVNASKEPHPARGLDTRWDRNEGGHGRG